MNIKHFLSITCLITTSLLTGCAPSALQMANSQADAASRSTPQFVDINAPFDAAKAKAALAKGHLSPSGVLFHRLDITGRDETGWPPSPLIKNQFLANFDIFLSPESPQMTALYEATVDQQSTMKKWYTNAPGILNRQPQARLFRTDAELNQLSLATKSDRFGRYEFRNLKPGRYYIYAGGWQTGSYNKDVYAGSSEYSDGTGLYGARGTARHTRAVPVNFKTYLMYWKAVDVTSSSATLESRMEVDYNRMSIEYDK